MKTLIFLFLIVNLTIVVCFGQGASVKADANACELNSLHLDGLRNELASNPTAKVIAKSYTGKSENIRVGKKRNGYIGIFLVQNKGFDPSRLEFVNAGRLETLENPKTEFYIVQAGETEGTLYLVTYSRPNRTPCLDCCREDFLPENIGSKPKPDSVKKLVELTFRMHSYVGSEEQLASLPGRKDAKEVEENAVKQRIEVFDDALKVNNKLTPEQKEFVRSNCDRLNKMTDKIVDDTIKANFPTEKWIKEGLQKSYTAKFTVKELETLVAFFQAANGQRVLKYVRLSKMMQLITLNGGKLDFTPADKADHDKFAANLLGKKFMTAYIDNTSDSFLLEKAQ